MTCIVAQTALHGNIIDDDRIFIAGIGNIPVGGRGKRLFRVLQTVCPEF